MFVALLVALAGCLRAKPPADPASCGAGWARRDPGDAQKSGHTPGELVDGELATRTIAAVHVAGVDPPLARTLEATLETRVGQLVADAPIAADLRRLWALGVVGDARIELEGDRVTFVLTPWPRIGRVVIPRPDRAALRRFALLPGAAYEPQRIARIAAAVTQNYVREGYVDAHVDVTRVQRGDRVDVCVDAVPGPKITIRSVTFPGRKRMPEATLLAQLHGEKANLNRRGGLYDADALEFAKTYLLNEYYEAGMVEASIGEVRVHRSSDQLDIEVPVVEGAVYVVGTTTVRIGEEGTLGVPHVTIPLAYGELFKRSRVQAAMAAIGEATGAEVVPLTKIDHAHARVDITFELTWRFPWDALRLWLLR